MLEAAVVGKPNSEWGEIVYAFVVLKAGKRVSSDELIRHCVGKVAAYKKPRAVEIVTELPKNPSGKLVRRRLKDKLAAQAP